MENQNSNLKTIAYWVITGLLTIMLTFSGVGAIVKLDFLVEAMAHVGLPLYFMNILGVSYVIAAVVIIAPGFPRLKEWAHVGVMIAMIGAISSHILIGDAFEETVPSILLLSLNVTSFLLRPANRQLGGAFKERVKVA